MTTIDIDGKSEEEFRRSIESRLRQGLSDKAVEKLRALLEPFAGPGKALPERFLTVTAEDLALGGWDALGDVLRRHDRPGRPVTGLSITFGWSGEDVPQPDAEGRLSPLIETSYYTDDAFPFSQSSRDDLLEGYSYHGCTWTGDCEATDSALWLTGIDDLHGALAVLEARLLASDEPDEEGILAGSLGACLISVLLFQAVDARIAQGGLARPLCVMSGSNGVYPYFDAPVAGFPEDARKAAEAAEDEVVVDAGVPAPRYSSLLVTGIPRAQKRAVLVLAETADEEASRIARLRGIAHAEAHAAAALPEPPLRSDGTIASAPASPLLVKKPSGQSWDFREMLSPFEPEAGSGEGEPLELDQDWDEVEPIEPDQDWGGGSPSEPKSDWSDEQPIEPEAASSDTRPFELEEDWDEPAPLEPHIEPLPVLSDRDREAPIGPGFSLLESLRSDRQQSIFPLPDFHTAEEEEEPEPALLVPEVPVEEAAAAPAVVEVPAEVPTAAASEPAEMAAETEPTMPAAAALEPPAWALEPSWLREVEARILPKGPQGKPVLAQSASVEQAAAKGLWARLRDWWYGRS